jgi:hypothetical protein
MGSAGGRSAPHEKEVLAGELIQVLSDVVGDGRLVLLEFLRQRCGQFRARQLALCQKLPQEGAGRVEGVIVAGLMIDEHGTVVEHAEGDELFIDGVAHRGTLSEIDCGGKVRDEVCAWRASLPTSQAGDALPPARSALLVLMKTAVRGFALNWEGAALSARFSGRITLFQRRRGTGALQLGKQSELECKAR